MAFDGIEPQPRRQPSGDLAERILEVPLCVVALALLAPLMAMIAISIRVQDGGPALFAQTRTGRDGRRFPCLKFRTMAPNAELLLAELLRKDPRAREQWRRDHKLGHDPRITTLGRFLRVSSLDELPQLFNVIRGEMSLVGPRPIVPAEIHRYGRYYGHYCSIRPGLTGLWQISGRSEVNYRRRVALDILYVRRRCWRLYLWVLLQTVPAVLLRRGAR